MDPIAAGSSYNDIEIKIKKIIKDQKINFDKFYRDGNLAEYIQLFISNIVNTMLSQMSEPTKSEKEVPITLEELEEWKKKFDLLKEENEKIPKLENEIKLKDNTVKKSNEIVTWKRIKN